jgi:NAD(P)-dependent dehydrogenase (short-subunit alcohol dehydrogenase family)
VSLSNPFDLTGKVAIVTGASRGIGRAAAEAMAACGAKVVISSRNLEPCEAVAKAIVDAGGEATAIACNISHRDQCEALIGETEKRFGPVDALVCNAAANPFYGSILDLPDEVFDKIMRSNIRSNLWLAKLAAPGMKAKGGGTITIVSSIAALRASPMIAAYGISKAGDVALAKNLAQELGPDNIRVNCVAPGLIKTDFARALWEDEAAVAKRNAVTPLRRIGEPAEIGGIVAFLASPAASFMTGETVVADGGVTAV